MTIPVSIGARYEADVSDHTLAGAGVCRVDGYTIFVDGAIKGERVAFAPYRVTAKYAAARLLHTLLPSPARTQPFCAHYGQCGGCALQFVDYARHLQILRDGLAAALRRVPDIGDIPPIAAMERPFHYRCKAVFTAAVRDGRIRIGFLSEKSHHMTPVDDCPLLHPPLMEAARAVEREAGRPASPLAAAGLSQVMVRAGLRTRERMIALRTLRPLSRAGGRELAARLPGIDSLYAAAGKGAYRLVAGAPFITEKILGLTLRISPDAFSQVNPLQTDTLYRIVREHVGDVRPALLLDAYCGTGSIGLTAAGAAREVIGVESVAAAVADAQENARMNGIENASFRQGMAEDVLPEMLRAGARPGMIIVDPPRRGVDAALIEAVAAARVPHIVYISCNPFTLARDLIALTARGYRVVSVRGVDLFAWTGHVETVVLMSCQNP